MSQNQADESPTTVLVKLRTRMNDLLRTGVVTPEGFGMYQQTMLQLLQEFDRRKATCFQQADTLRAQAAASEAQGHAFSVSGSVLFAVVNGYLDIQEKNAREEAERKAQEAPKSEVVAPKKGKGGRPKKKAPEASEPAVGAEASTPEAGSNAPDEG
jgi:hypothetical protein